MSASNLRIVEKSGEDALQELRHEIRAVGWEKQVERLLEAAGLSVAEAYFSQSPKPANGTILQVAGIDTMQSFIETLQYEPSTHELKRAWKDCIHAYYYKSVFGIRSNEIKEIISQVRDISSSLGRLPCTQREFQETKEMLMEQKFKGIKCQMIEAQEQNELLSIENLELKKKNEAYRARVSDNLTAIKSLEQQLADAETKKSEALYVARAFKKKNKELEIKLEGASNETSTLQAKIDSLGSEPFAYKEKYKAIVTTASERINKAVQLIHKHKNEAERLKGQNSLYLKAMIIQGAAFLALLASAIILS